MTVANTTIQIKKSLVSGVTPSSLANGEIAINQADGKLFYSNPTGGISYIKNSQSFSTINADGSLILAGSPSDILSFANGQGIVVSGNTSSKVISYAIDSSVVTLSGSQTLTDKTFASSSYGTYPIRVKDIIENDVFKIYDSGGGVVSTWLTATYLYFNNLKWPNVDGTNGQVLTTNGSGTLSWSTIGSGSGFVTTSGTETLTNKTLTDSSTYFQDESDNSKKLQFQLSGISTATTRTLTIPNVNGTIITTGDSGTVTNTMLSGSIANAKLANSTISGVSLGSNLNTLTIGTGLSGTSYNGSSAVTIAIDSSVATLTGSQTLSNKTLSSPIVTGNINGDVSSTGLLKSLNSVGDEGGEIVLAIPQTNTTIANNVVIDIYQNKLRFFEQGGSARGFYVDITSGSGGASTNLAGSSGDVTLSGTQTLTNKTLTDSSTYFQDETDNTKKLQFQLSGISTSTTRTLTIPNVNGTIITTGDSGTVTSTMINRTNLDADLLDGQHGSYYSPLSYTQSAFDKSNTVTNIAQGAYDTANGIISLQSGINSTQNTNITTATNLAQGAYNQANTDYTTISLTSGTYGNTAYIPSITVASNGRISSVSSQQINLSTLTIGTGLSGTSYNGSGDVTIAIDSTVATLTGTQTLSNKTLKPYNVISSAGSSISYEGGEQYTYGSTSPTSVFSYSASTYRSSKLIVQITQGTNYQVSEIMIIHNGTTTTMTEYGVMSTNGSLGTFTSDISGGNVRLLLTLGSATSSTVKTSYTLIVS
jgi:hypothetical protein